MTYVERMLMQKGAGCFCCAWGDLWKWPHLRGQVLERRGTVLYLPPCSCNTTQEHPQQAHGWQSALVDCAGNGSGHAWAQCAEDDLHGNKAPCVCACAEMLWDQASALCRDHLLMVQCQCRSCGCAGNARRWPRSLAMHHCKLLHMLADLLCSRRCSACAARTHGKAPAPDYTAAHLPPSQLPM